MPSFPSPIVNGFFDEVPVCAVLAVREEPGAAEAEHEDLVGPAALEELVQCAPSTLSQLFEFQTEIT